MVEGPVRAGDADFESILALANACFVRDRDGGGMLARWPHCYTREPGRIQSFIMRENGRAISMVAYADQEVDVAGKAVRVAGITGVSTLPEYRGKGYMTRLLASCIEDMAARHYALSELGGDRQRYRHFGWELGSREWQFQFSRRSLAGFSPDGFSTGPYSPDDLAGLIGIHDRMPYGIRRSALLHEQVFNRLGWEVWVCRQRERIVAYLGLNAESARVDEFGGSCEGLAAIIHHLLHLPDRERLLLCSPWDHPHNRRFFEIGARWNPANPRMVRIIDLHRTLEGFGNQLAQRYREAGISGSRSVVLGIEGADRGVAVAFSPEGVSAFPTRETADAILLSHDAMVRFLFGSGGPSAVLELSQRQRFLNALLPLDFFLWPLERV